jgi:hypothetical protein
VVYTEHMKRLIMLVVVVGVVLVGNLLIVRQQTAYKNRLNDAVSSITPSEVKGGVVLGCKVLALQRRDDYPGVIRHKSVPEIRQLIITQPPAC